MFVLWLPRSWRPLSISRGANAGLHGAQHRYNNGPYPQKADSVPQGIALWMRRQKTQVLFLALLGDLCKSLHLHDSVSPNCKTSYIKRFELYRRRAQYELGVITTLQSSWRSLGSQAVVHSGRFANRCLMGKLSRGAALGWAHLSETIQTPGSGLPARVH